MFGTVGLQAHRIYHLWESIRAIYRGQPIPAAQDCSDKQLSPQNSNTEVILNCLTAVT